MTRGQLLTAALVMAGAISSPRAEAAGTGEATLVLHVDNYAQITAAELRRAQRAAARIYAADGVRIVWAAADTPGEPARAEVHHGANPPRALHVRVLLLCTAMGELKAAAEGLDDRLLGRASALTGRAYIFAGRIRDASARAHGDFGVVLGRVIAHEVGHLMLPPNSHSAEGIMRPSMDMRSDSTERFTTRQAREIRERLRAPYGAEPAAASQ